MAFNLLAIAAAPISAQNTTNTDIAGDQPSVGAPDNSGPQAGDPGAPAPAPAPDPAAFLLLGSGVLLLEAGGVFGSIGYESARKGDDCWRYYWITETESHYTEYEGYHAGYQALGVISYSLWGAGAATALLPFYLLADDSLSISAGGKVVFSAGLIFALAGNFFSFLAADTGIDHLDLWDNYIGNSEGGVLNTGSEGYSTYISSRIVSYACWGLSGAAMLGAYLFPGERRTVAPSLLEKILITAGMAMITGGNYLHSFCANLRIEAEIEWVRYEISGWSNSSYQAAYAQAYDAYALARVLTYGLWVGGGILVLSAVLFEDSGPPPGEAIPVETMPSETAPEELSVEVNLVPAPDGFMVAARLRL